MIIIGWTTDYYGRRDVYAALWSMADTEGNVTAALRHVDNYKLGNGIVRAFPEFADLAASKDAVRNELRRAA